VSENEGGPDAPGPETTGAPWAHDPPWSRAEMMAAVETVRLVEQELQDFGESSLPCPTESWLASDARSGGVEAGRMIRPDAGPDRWDPSTRADITVVADNLHSTSGRSHAMPTNRDGNGSGGWVRVSSPASLSKPALVADRSRNRDGREPAIRQSTIAGWGA
jgi:hypothetical protein